MRKLYLVRHAEPALRGVLLGQSDPPITEHGREAAREALAGLPAASVFSSPLRRALETAELMGNPVRVLADLTEISLGEWDGKSWEEVRSLYPDLVRRKEKDWLGETPPGGETWAAFARRIRRALTEIEAGPFPAVVVAHAAVNAEIAHQIGGADPASFSQKYCEVREYELETRN